MPRPPARFLTWSGLYLLFLAIVGCGCWFVYMSFTIGRQAETNLQSAFFALELVERFVSEKGRWLRSWAQLEGVPMPEGRFGRKWPAASPDLQKRIFIDFGVDPRDVARQDPMTFTAIRPIGPYYEYRDYGGVASLQRAIRQSVPEAKESASSSTPK